MHTSSRIDLQGRTAFHSFSPWGRRWDEGAPAVRYGIIVAPFTPPSPLRGEGVKSCAHPTANMPHSLASSQGQPNALFRVRGAAPLLHAPPALHHHLAA